MGIYVRETRRIGGSRVNLSKSGVSISKTFGKRVTVNSRGRVSIRLAKGSSLRTKLF